MARITIDSILGGHSATTNFAMKNQFLASLGIDPSQPMNDNADKYSSIASGLIRPVSTTKIGGTAINKFPLWIKSNPKSFNTCFVYDSQGSLYQLTNSSMTVTGISDAGTMPASHGNGMEYYDNYIYLATDTDIARYGPLNGSPVLTASYWQGTLGKAALVNTSYIIDRATGLLTYPNHPMHRHSDGKLYIGDVVNGQGVIHIISTTKTTVEGDTDNGSTYQALTFGFGLYPTVIESYGSQLVIALSDTVAGASSTGSPAKLAFWDTTSQNFNSMIWVEFPDQFISAMKNVDGVLYLASSNITVGGAGTAGGFRITQYVGGYTVQEVDYIETGSAPFPGAMDGDARHLIFGSYTNTPEPAACVYSYGLQKGVLGQGIFNIMRSTSPIGTGAIGTAFGTGLCCYSVLINSQQVAGLLIHSPIIGWGNDTPSYGLDKQDYSTYGSAPSMFWSQKYKIGEPFEIKRIRVPMVNGIGASTTIVPTLYFDDGNAQQTLTTINNTNFPNKAETGFGRVANLRTAGDGTNIIRGQNNFWLGFRWTGTEPSTIGLPIIVDFDVIPD